MKFRHSFCLYLLLSLSITTSAFAEKSRRSYYHWEAFSSFSSGEHTPFWFSSGQRGRVSLNPNTGYTSLGMGNEMKWRDFSLSSGVEGVAAYRHVTDFALQQLYVDLGYRPLHLSMGMRDYDASLVNNELGTGDFLFSRNTRNIPEINLYTDFITIPFTRHLLSFKFDFALGRFLDGSYVDRQANRANYTSFTTDFMLHHKMLVLKIEDPTNRFPFAFSVSMKHAAEWGGKTRSTPDGEIIKKQPVGLRNFMRIVLGKAGGSDAMETDQDNCLGNHIGDFSLRLDYKHSFCIASVYWSHPYEDGSGMNIGKWFRDGLLGVQLQLLDFPWIQTVLYEHLSTRDQSGPYHWLGPVGNTAVGADNYYNNGVYTQGWSYFGRTIGNMLILSPEYFDRLSFPNNRVKAHHLGVKGNILPELDYETKLTYSINYGTHATPFLQKKEIFSAALRVGYTLPDSQGAWKFNLHVAGDKGGDLIGNNWGIALGVARKGIF